MSLYDKGLDELMRNVREQKRRHAARTLAEASYRLDTDEYGPPDEWWEPHNGR